MARNKVALAVVMVFALGLALVGCTGSPASAAPSIGKATIGFTSAQPNQSQLVYYLAKYLGYWAEDGLDVELEWTSGTSQAMQLMAAGQIQFSNANHDGMIFAVHNGAKLIAVFQEHTKCEFQFAVPTTSDIKTVEALKGKKIGVSALSSGFVPFAKAAFFEAGMDPDKDLNLIEVGSGATAATAISTGEIDALGLWEVAFANLENSLGYDYFRYIKPPIYDRLACNAIITTVDLVENKPEVVIAFLRGVSKATLFFQTNPEASIHILYEMFPETKPQGKDDATVLAEALHTAASELLQRSNRNRPNENPMGWWGYLVASEFVEAQKVHYNMGSLTELLPVERFMINKFVEYINAFNFDDIVEQAKNYKK